MLQGSVALELRARACAPPRGSGRDRPIIGRPKSGRHQLMRSRLDKSATAGTLGANQDSGNLSDRRSEAPNRFPTLLAVQRSISADPQLRAHGQDLQMTRVVPGCAEG